MQTRRGFFKSIAGLFVAGMTIDPAKLLADPWSQGPAYSLDLSVGQMVDEDQRNIAMRRLTQFMHSELVDSLNRVWPEVDGRTRKLGDGHAEIFGINLSLNEKELELDDEVIRDRFVRPAMGIMARGVLNAGATQFHRLPFPGGTDFAARVTGRGVTLRGCRAYDMSPEEFGGQRYITRFDVAFS